MTDAEVREELLKKMTVTFALYSEKYKGKVDAIDLFGAFYLALANFAIEFLEFGDADKVEATIDLLDVCLDALKQSKRGEIDE